MKEESPPRGRFGRLLQRAERRHVPLLTILVTVGVVAATYLAGKLIYRIKDILLLIVVAGFIALLLNRFIIQIEKYDHCSSLPFSEAKKMENEKNETKNEEKINEGRC